MNKVFTYCFIILIFVIYTIYKKKRSDWGDYLGIKESFTNINSVINKNSLSSNFIDNNYFIGNKKIFAINHTEMETINIYSNYKYSLESKFGFELSKLYKINNIESHSLHYNLNHLQKYSETENKKEHNNDIFMCYEQDYYDYLEKEKISGDQVKYICSLYYTELFLIVKEGIPIKKIRDILIYPDYYKVSRDTQKNLLPEKLVIGIPNDNISDNDKESNNFNYNAIKFFNTIGLDITNNDKYTFVYGKEKELFSRMKNNIKTVDKNKEKVDVKDTIHIIFNISSYKNPFFIEYLRTKNAKIIGTKDINKNILDQKFLGNYKKKIDMSKYIISNQYGKFNNMTIKESDIVLTDTISFRVCLLCHKSAEDIHIYNLLSKIYGNLDNLKNKLNKYLFNSNNNVLRNILDPHQMFYLKEIGNKSQYHPGAEKFYKKVNFIKDNVYDTGNIYVRDNELYEGETSKLFY
jgi:hypothetical protein